MAEGDISPEAGAAQPVPAGDPAPTTSDQGQGAPSTHYKTLEDADAAARRFQGERDRLQADLDKVLVLPDGTRAGADDLRRFRDQMLPITEREDFSDYLGGRLAKTESPPAQPDNDEFLTDTERANKESISTLRSEVKQQTQGLAELHFREHQREVEEAYHGLLEPYRTKAADNFRNIVQLGALNDTSKLNRKLVEDLYLQQVPLEDRHALYAKVAQINAEKTVTEQQNRATTVPGPERPSEERPPPKNLRESMDRAAEFLSAQRARGG